MTRIHATVVLADLFCGCGHDRKVEEKLAAAHSTYLQNNMAAERNSMS